MNWVTTIYSAILFFVLVPSVLLRIPPKGSKYMVAAVHAIVFALIWHFTCKFVWRMSVGLEGMDDKKDDLKKHHETKCRNDYNKCMNKHLAKTQTTTKTATTKTATTKTATTK